MATGAQTQAPPQASPPPSGHAVISMQSLLVVFLLLAAASFSLSRPAVGTDHGPSAVLVAKLFGRS